MSGSRGKGFLHINQIFGNSRKKIVKGDSEVRRLLYIAAMQGRRSPQWAPYYLKLRERGLSRKLAKVSFAWLRSGSQFVPSGLTACVST